MADQVAKGIERNTVMRLDCLLQVGVVLLPVETQRHAGRGCWCP